MAKSAYCGAGKIPKGKKRGSMKECVDQNQVRYYGVKKVDPRLLEASKKKKKPKLSKAQLATQMVGKRAKINVLKKKMADAKSVDEKKKMKEEITKLIAEFKVIAEQVRKLSRASSKKKRSSRKRSSKRKMSRKSRKRSSKKKSSRKSKKRSSKKKSSRRKKSRKSRKRSSKKK